MFKLKPVGVTIYATGMFALGLLCILQKDFIIGRPPVIKSWTGLDPWMAYIGGAIVLLSSLAILIRKKAIPASIIIASLLLLLVVPRHLPYFHIDRLNCFKAFAFIGGSLIIGSSFLENKVAMNKDLIKKLLFIGTILLAAFFIAAGYAHIKYAGFVKTYIPGYIPFHGFFTYCCAVCLFAGGIGLFIPGIKKWAALFSGIMLSGWFLLLHIPRFITNSNDASDQLGLCESFTFAGIFFCLAGIWWEHGSRLKTA